jgi:hypothetical protein
MERITELSALVTEFVMGQQILWLSLIALIVVFAIYLHIFPRSLDFFTNPEKPLDGEKRVRSEPPENQPQ